MLVAIFERVWVISMSFVACWAVREVLVVARCDIICCSDDVSVDRFVKYSFVSMRE